MKSTQEIVDYLEAMPSGTETNYELLTGDSLDRQTVSIVKTGPFTYEVENTLLDEFGEKIYFQKKYQFIGSLETASAINFL